MIFTRIKRGAGRTSVLIRNKLQLLSHQVPRVQLKPLLRSAYMVFLATHVAAAPLPFSTAVAAEETVEPPLPVPSTATGTSLLAAEIVVTTASASPDQVVAPLPVAHLASVQVGESNADVAAAALAAAQAQKEAEEKAQAAAAQQKKRTLAVQAVASVASLSHDQYVALFQKYFGDVWQTAMAICTAESGLVANKISQTYDYGVCQINQVHRNLVDGNVTALLDPETNIRVAAEIYHDNGGWHPWTMYRNQMYLNYL